MKDKEIKLSIMELKVLSEIYKRNNPRETYDFADSIMVNLKEEEDRSIDFFLNWINEKTYSKSFKQLIQILEQS